MATGEPNEILVAFESGHYKKIRGTWKGDSVWGHFIKESGGMVHVNREKVEYIETFGPAQLVGKKSEPPLPGNVTGGKSPAEESP